MRKVIHLLPYDGIGGAEAAARSMLGTSDDALEFQVRYLFPKVSSPLQRARTNNPLAVISAVRAVLREKPDLLIVSLWRSCIAGLLVRLFRPSTRMVVLIHNSVDAHALDHVFTRWAMKLSCAVWADSDASVSQRFPDTPKSSITILPFLTDHLHPLLAANLAQPVPRFIFWGRLATQKNLARALGLFHRIWKNRPHARFTVIGPDAGQLMQLEARSPELGLASAVRFLGAQSFSDILEEARTHAFYLQTSTHEGMAMSVVEAMQLGLVPVVTPVGEIARYCRNEVNAVFLEDDDKSASAILNLLDDANRYGQLRANAIETWSETPLYRDAVRRECLRLLDQ
jgi:glycosyltransferase involved in cell wall biosynthesis